MHPQGAFFNAFDTTHGENMSPLEIIAQIIGIIAMVFNIGSYQQKRQQSIIAWQLFNTTLFTVNFFMLGAYTGALLNAIGIVRAIVFLNKEKLKTNHPLWLVGFIAVYVLSYVFTFTLLKKPFTTVNAIVEILPVIGMTATTVAFRCKTAKSTRLLGLISAPTWLVYNIVSRSIGATCCAAFCLISIIIGLIRFDKQKEEPAHE